MNSETSTQDSPGIGLGIIGILQEGYKELSDASTAVLRTPDSHRQPQTSLDFNFDSLLSPTTRTSTPSVSRLPAQSSSVVAPRFVVGGASIYSSNSRPYSNRSHPSPTKWEAEELWDVDPDKLDDEEVEILGALLPVVALNERENQNPERVSTSLASESIHTVTDLRTRQQQQRPQIPGSTTTSYLPQTLPTRSSFASLRNLLDRPLPPLPIAQQPIYPPTPPSPFSFNSTPPLNQASPKVDPSQVLGDRVESLHLARPGESRRGRHFDERGAEVWQKSVTDYDALTESYGKGERTKKMEARDELDKIGKLPRRKGENGEVAWSTFEAKGEVSGSPAEKEKKKNNQEEKGELDENHDEFAVAFLQTPPPTPPTLAMTNKSIPRHTTPNPFFPNSIFSHSNGSLVSPPKGPPSTPLPALPTQAAHTSHSRQSSGTSHSLPSTRSSISTAPTSPLFRRSYEP
ncbi:hypothetical protein JCM5350_003879 [Sporobolomyces pararoseus]